MSERRGARAPRLHLYICLLLALLLWAAACSASLAAEIGNQWGYTLVQQVQLTNSGSTDARNITVSAPLADASFDYPYCQLVGTELSPYPASISVDANGRRTATYTIPRLAAGQTLMLTQRYAMLVGAVSYDLEAAAASDDYTEAERERLAVYFLPTDAIQSDDPSIRAFTLAHIDASATPYETARSLFSAVNLYLTYSLADVDQSATATLARGSGSCEGYTNLYLACLRAAGVACRQVCGYLYQPASHVSEGYVDYRTGAIYLEQLGHTWAEVYVPGQGWLPVDPTFTYTLPVDGVETKLISWNTFGNVSAANRYVCLHEGDSSTDLIRTTYIGGQLALSFSAQLTAGLNYTPFADISGHWAEEAIRYCVENSLFSGVSSQSFAPDISMTRAMFVTVLGRLYEQLYGELPDSHLSAPDFTDIDPAAYYGPYLAWATQQGVISGYGGGRFGPNDPVTREQMATIMRSFLMVCGYGDHIRFGSIGGFEDAAAISAWAGEGVSACVGCGLLSGYPDGCFYPAAQATRAQVAAILQRLNYWIVGLERAS